jgi:hypothetical protein
MLALEGFCIFHVRVSPLTFSIPIVGIVGYADGLIIISSAGGLFYKDLGVCNTTMIASAEGTGISGSGLTIDGDRLYFTHSALNHISVYDLAYESFTRQVTAKLVGVIANNLFDSPAASALYKEWIFSTNAQFDNLGCSATGEGNLTTFSEQFTIVATRKSDVVAV